MKTKRFPKKRIIMEIDVTKLDEIFIQYGYDVKITESNIRVYLLHQGMYYGAEIISLEDNNNLEDICSQYAQLGYAVKTPQCHTIEDFEKYLFDGFFKTSLTAKRINDRYQEYSNIQVRHYGDSSIKYKYINVPYSILEDTIQKKGNLIETVDDVIRKKGAFLVLIEASAGFGKTCTAYELYKSLEPNSEDCKPLFLELTKTRDAKRFEYILPKAIQSEYPGGMNNELVIYNIRRGRIPLIIDGFDELLSSTIDSGRKVKRAEEFQSVETMLSTIGDLLLDNAKVILTSRKTAIFAGDQFEDWVDSYNGKFEVIRFQIDKPDIEDWLSKERIQILSDNNVPISYISNPVLLTYLKNVDDVNFNQLAAESDTIIDKYFTYLLTREMTRQNILIPSNEQMVIFQNLARSFSEFGFNGDERSFVRELIIDNNREKLEQWRKLSDPKPTIEELANTLVNHALLDRLGSGDCIGFINDFVVGILLGKNLLSTSVPNDYKLSDDYFEKIINSFKYEREDERKRLGEKLDTIMTDKSMSTKFKIDSILKNTIVGTYSDITFVSLELSHVHFHSNKCKFINTGFTGMTFIDCYFDKRCFENCNFVGCSFIDCNTILESAEVANIYCYGCNDQNSSFIDNLTYSDVDEIDETDDANIDYYKMVLEKYFKVDGRTPRMKLISALKDSLNECNPRELSKTIQVLEKEKYIIINGDKSFITQKGISHYNSLQ